MGSRKSRRKKKKRKQYELATVGNFMLKEHKWHIWVKDVGFKEGGSFWFVSIFRQENSNLFYVFENVSKEGLER